MAAKTYLKQARDLISKKDFQGASDAAAQVLQHDPVNYNAWVSGELIDRESILVHTPDHKFIGMYFLDLRV
jgi:Tfp pilus assembly protein PilF